ncbi:MAG: PAS domain S-box protein [Pedobacter sp.]|nr:MAG: PAS domain S-box protein [Pedobacter sp.]
MLSPRQVSSEYELERLKALHSYGILEEGLMHELDNLVTLAAKIGKVPMAYVSFVDKEDVVLLSAVGIATEYMRQPRSQTICQHTMFEDSIFVVEDVKAESSLQDSILIDITTRIRFYASVPIKDKNGYPLGCLVLLDDEPRALDDYQREALQTIAIQVEAHLDLKRTNKELVLKTQRLADYEDIFTISPEIHCILDRRGEILFINNAVTHLLEYEVEETLGNSMWSYVFREDMDRIFGVMESGLKAKRKEFSIDFRVITKSNQFKWIGWSMVYKADRWYCFGRDITERKRVESEMTKLSFVASKVANAVVISDAHSKVTWVNEAFEKITGFALADVQGKRLADMIGGPDTDWLSVEKVRKMNQERKSFTIDMLAYKKDKSPIWLSVYNTVVVNEQGQIDSEVEIIIDITEKKKAEEELAILSLVASESKTGVTICNRSGEITWVNKSLERLTGYSLEELEGKLLGDVLSGPDTNTDLVYQGREKALHKEPYSIEVLAHHKNGSKIWLSVYNTPVLNAQGEVERQVELIHDITERKQVEQEIIASREQALQLSEAKEMFLSVMSHEIRTPLNAVIGMTHLLLDNDPKESQLNDLNILKFSSENLLHIINDILDFTKIETGNMHLEHIPFDLHSLTVDIVNSLQLQAGKNGNHLELGYNDQIPEVILGDKTRLYQILMNLLGNAIKFTENGKVFLRVDLASQSATDVLIHFEVVDTGIGISQDKQNNIFEPFIQAKADISRKYGGTGLGLAITKKLLRLYDSDIEVKSAEGMGTSFIFNIRFKKPLKNETPAVQLSEQHAFLNKRVLVVDDNEVNILIAKRFLSKWGLKTDFATNGEEAINKVLHHAYDLIFMDIRMPGVDGFETTRILRDLPGNYYKHVPIIALTASALHDEQARFLGSGMDGHILKPFNPVEIKALLTKFLGQK